MKTYKSREEELVYLENQIGTLERQIEQIESQPKGTVGTLQAEAYKSRILRLEELRRRRVYLEKQKK